MDGGDERGEEPGTGMGFLVLIVAVVGPGRGRFCGVGVEEREWRCFGLDMVTCSLLGLVPRRWIRMDGNDWWEGKYREELPKT